VLLNTKLKKFKTGDFMISSQHAKDYEDFSQHPLAPLFFEYVDILKFHNFHKEAEDLIAVSEKYYLPENNKIITKIIIEMQKAAVSDEKNKFDQLLQKLRN
jgi:hypothetical protein